MPQPVELRSLAPAERARLILNAAQADVAATLWRAAFGSAEDSAKQRSLPGQIGFVRPGGSFTAGEAGHGSALETLLAAMRDPALPVSTLPVPNAPVPDRTPVAEPARIDQTSAIIVEANARFGPALERAAQRTGVPAQALSAIIGAEAGRTANGEWNPLSRNPRSSAAGLGQFIISTWLDLARQPGTWLNRTARRQGLVDEDGQIAPDNRSVLLAMRYDPVAAIEAVADYARANIGLLQRNGIRVGPSDVQIARAAYLGHHLGPADAMRFYNGTLSPKRARTLLSAQIGEARAGEKIAAAGDAVRAHRAWLISYVGHHIGTAAAPSPNAGTYKNKG